MIMERDNLKAFSQKLKYLRSTFNVSQKTLGDVLGLEHYYITKWEKGIYKPNKDVSDLIARYFLVWHRWLYEDNDDFPIFLGTILFRSISKEDNLRKLVELIHLDGGHLTRIFLSNTTTAVTFQRSGKHPTSYFVPTDVALDTIKDLLLPLVENEFEELDKVASRKGLELTSKKASERAENFFLKLQKPLDEDSMHRLLKFSSRELIAQISDLLVETDRGIILKPYGADSRVISEDNVRLLYDALVKIAASNDEINEAVRRYYRTFKDKH